MAKARLPSAWLVLVPALALAAVGVRAVTAEMRASEEAARDRARSIASRLARSVDGLVAEYSAPLPKVGTAVTREEARAATAHLAARRALTFNGVSLSLDRDPPPDPGPVPRNETELVDDATKSAARLAREPNGSIAAAALMSAAARAVEHPVAKARLLFAAATFEMPSRYGDGWPSWSEAVSIGAGRRDADGTPFEVRALRLAAECVRRTHVGGACDEVELYQRVAEDPWGLPDRDSLLDDADHALQVTPWSARNARMAWDAARRIAHSAIDVPPSATFLTDLEPGFTSLSVWTAVEIDGLRTLLGGDVPGEAVGERVGREMDALVHEPRVMSIRLVSSGGAQAWGHKGLASGARNGVIETVALGGSLDAWSVEAVVFPESGVPATAWLLGGALVLTTGALLAGTIALRRAAERSARLAEERQTFLDHVAHELRTPAAAVQALTEELAAGHVPPEREALYGEHLLRESRRLSTLVEDTLDFARLDAGRLAFAMEPADLRDVVRRAVEESDGAGRVVARMPDEPLVRPVDAGALRRAVRNLVENAARHGGGDGPIRVDVSRDDGFASIAVADAGRGIAPEHLPRLFERFYRVPSATHEVKGVGLGLALCREVARGHGGDVTVASEPGKGSTFTIRLPLEAGDVGK